MRKRKKLQLNKETLRALTQQPAGRVAGGDTVTVDACTCGYTFHNQWTCNCGTFSCQCEPGTDTCECTEPNSDCGSTCFACTDTCWDTCWNWCTGTDTCWGPTQCQTCTENC